MGNRVERALADDGSALEEALSAGWSSATDSADALDLLAQVCARLVEQLDAERRRVAQLTTALQTNRDIAAAAGILMASRRLTRDEAMAQLRSASQHRHVKLHDLARDVLDAGTLDLPELP